MRAKKLSINKDALVTVQGKNYVFLKTASASFRKTGGQYRRPDRRPDRDIQRLERRRKCGDQRRHATQRIIVRLLTPPDMLAKPRSSSVPTIGRTKYRYLNTLCSFWSNKSAGATAVPRPFRLRRKAFELAPTTCSVSKKHLRSFPYR